MSILKTKFKKLNREFKLVGAYIPLPLNSFLSLVSIACNTSKSAVIKLLIQRMMEENKTDFVEMVIKQIAQQREITQLSLMEFRDQVRKELEEKEIAEEHITRILKSIK